MNAEKVLHTDEVSCNVMLSRTRSLLRRQFADLGGKETLVRASCSFSERQLKGQLLFWGAFSKCFLNEESDLWRFLFKSLKYFSILENQRISRDELATVLVDLEAETMKHVFAKGGIPSVSIRGDVSIMDELSVCLHVTRTMKTQSKPRGIYDLLGTVAKRESVMKDYLADTFECELSKIVYQLKSRYPRAVSSQAYITKFANKHLQDRLANEDLRREYTGMEFKQWIERTFSQHLSVVDLVEEVAAAVACLRVNHDQFYSLELGEKEGDGTKSLKACDVVRLIHMLSIYKHADIATIIRYVLWAYPDTLLYKRIVELAQLPDEKDNQLLQVTAAIARTLLGK